MAIDERLPHGADQKATYCGELDARGLSTTRLLPGDFLHISPSNRLTVWRGHTRLKVGWVTSQRDLQETLQRAENRVRELEEELPDELIEHARAAGSTDTDPVARDDRQLPEVLREGISLPEDPKQLDLLLLLISAMTEMNLHQMPDDPGLPGRRLMFWGSPGPT